MLLVNLWSLDTATLRRFLWYPTSDRRTFFPPSLLSQSRANSFFSMQIERGSWLEMAIGQVAGFRSSYLTLEKTLSLLRAHSLILHLNVKLISIFFFSILLYIKLLVSFWCHIVFCKKNIGEFRFEDPLLYSIRFYKRKKIDDFLFLLWFFFFKKKVG